ncbi:unnamed protein product [Clavelina lepadiformis]|uniref:Transcription factor Iwr1 domain-containing protein n=1 Tax=Clavelina lepadiformis TaxID=159417 RepID=A0ABP0F6E2_CLALP
MSHLQPMQHSLDPADGHLDNVIFGQINLNDGDDESPGLQPTLEATMTDKQSTLNYPRGVASHKDENGRFHVFDLDRNFNDEIIEDEEIVLNPNIQKSYAFHHGGEDDDNYDDWGYDSDD